MAALQKGTRITGRDRAKLATELTESGAPLRGRGCATRGKIKGKAKQPIVGDPTVMLAHSPRPGSPPDTRCTKP
jgi:hypothetical protein